MYDFHEGFAHRSNDPAERVTGYDKAIDKATKHERGLVQAQKAINADLATLDTRFAETRIESASDRQRRVDLRLALEQVERGLHPAEGAPNILAEFAGWPGLTETRERIKALRIERAEWLHRRDHNDETKLYRLKPGMRHRVDGRLLIAGETVRLSWRGVKAIGDKFEPEPVEEPVDPPVEAVDTQAEVSAEAESPASGQV